MQNQTTGPRRLGIAKLEARIGWNRCTIWRKYKADPPQFPAPHFIGARRYWFESEIAEWERAEMSRPSEARRSNLPVAK